MLFLDVILTNYTLAAERMRVNCRCMLPIPELTTISNDPGQVDQGENSPTTSLFTKVCFTLSPLRSVSVGPLQYKSLDGP